MLARAKIVSVDYNKRLCNIRIPILENQMSYSQSTIPAAICITPGLFNNLKADDEVFVGFDEERLERPIILGKFFVSTQDESEHDVGKVVARELNIKQTATVSELKVSNKATLPTSTLILSEETGGSFNVYIKIRSLEDQQAKLEDQLAKLEDQLAKLEDQLAKLEDRVDEIQTSINSFER